MTSRSYSIAAVLIAGGLWLGATLRAHLSGGIEAHVLVLALALPAIGFVLRAPTRSALATLAMLAVACAALPFYPFAIWGLVAVGGAVVFATGGRQPLLSWELLLGGGIGLASLAVAAGALHKGMPRSSCVALGGVILMVSAGWRGEHAALRTGVGLATLGMLVAGLDFLGRSSGSGLILLLLGLGGLWREAWGRSRLWLLLPIGGAVATAASTQVLALFGWGTIVGGALFAMTFLLPRRGRSWLARILWGLAGALLVAAGVTLASYLSAAHPHAGGVDFYYFLCLARDRVLRPEAVPDMQYVYSPGVYVFWGAAYRISDSMVWLRSIVLGLLVLDSALVLWIVGRATRSWAFGALAGCCCLRFMTRFEGLEGTTEPVIVFSVLLGLAIWGGKRLEGREGLARAVVLGASLGLAIYAKQQGVFLALAAGCS